MPEAEYEGGGREQFGPALASGGLGTVHKSLPPGDGSRYEPHIGKVFHEDALRDLTLQERRAYLNQVHDSLRLVLTTHNPVKQHPYWSQLFAWPDKIIVRFGGIPKLGVRAPFSPLSGLEKPMDWLGRGYQLMQPEERGWWIGRVAIAVKLARVMHLLQQKTLVHTDLSPRNIFGDVFSGEMTLIDCDGIISPQTPLVQTALGSPYYTAPELLMPRELREQLGIEKKATFNTDNHALAVLLYQLLLYRHPLQGPKRHPQADIVEQDEEDRWKFAEGATYIENQFDTSNRPQKGLIVSAATLGDQVKTLFDRAFIAGLRPGSQGQRPYAADWEDALTRLYDRIVPCPNPGCAQRFFAAPDKPGQPIKCSLCGEELRGPYSVPYLRLLHYDGNRFVDDNYLVVGWPGRVLHEWHLATHVSPTPESGHVYDPTPVAHFEYDRDEDTWYLRNVRMDRLLLANPRSVVPIGGLVPLEHGMTMWLSGAGTSRLARVEMSATTPGAPDEPIYALPNLMTANNAPWPTIEATPQDKQWTVMSPITLKPYSYSYSTVSEEPPIPEPKDEPPHRGGYIARVPVYGLLFGALVGILAFIIRLFLAPDAPLVWIAGAAVIGGVLSMLLSIPVTRAQWRNDYAQWKARRDFFQP
jgi:hypothetical protein